MSDKDNKGRPDLDLDFTHHASDGMRNIDVRKVGSLDARLEKADQTYKKAVEKEQVKLLKLEQNEKKLAIKKAAAQEAKDTQAEQRAERQIAQNKLMRASKEQELSRVYYFGNKGQTFDAENKHDKNAKTRSDVSTDKIVGEETIGKNKKRAGQIKGHVAEAKATGKVPLMHAPNMKPEGVRSAERKGMNVAQSQDEYHKKAREVYRVTKDDPQKVKAALEGNAAKKQDLAAKVAQEKAKTHATDKSREARQEITAKIDKLRGRKIAADLSGDRQKKIDAKKANTEEVKQLRAAQHDKIRAQKVEQKARQEQKQGEQQGHKAKQDYDRSKGQESKVTHKYEGDRFKSVEQRAYDRAKARGADDAAARKAGEDRVKHVKAKMELNAERQELRESVKTLKEKEAVAYFEKDAKFREERVRDLKEQAKREGRDYQGPPSKDQGLRTVETKLQAYEFTTRVRFEEAAKRENLSPQQYDRQKNSIENSLAQYHSDVMARHYGRDTSYSRDQSQTNSQSYTMKR